MSVLISLLIFLGGLVHANALDYLTVPEPIWGPVSVPSLGKGNGVFLTPDDTTLMITSSDGSFTALNANDGTSIYSSKPDTIQSLPIFSTSGVSCGESEDIGEFAIYAVSDGFVGVDSSFCRVIAMKVGATIEKLWESSPLEGACSGTPKVSSDGKYVFLTHNLVSVGHFTVLLAKDGVPLYSQFNPRQPYSPLGIYHNPSSGRYDGGQNNTNDIVVWAYSPYPGENGVGNSATFAFQIPIEFDGDSTDVVLGVLWLGNTDFQSTTAPRLANKGLNLYFSGSHSEFISWVGVPGKVTGAFDENATANTGFNRGDPPQLAPFNTLAASSDDEAPVLFGGTAGLQFVALNADGEKIWKTATEETVQAEARVSPDDSRVYFVELNGKVHSLNTSDGTQLWKEFVTMDSSNVTSEFAMESRGEKLYFGDSSGNINAWMVANSSPSLSPSPSAGQLSSPVPTIPSSTLNTSSAPSVAPLSNLSGMPSSDLNASTAPTLAPLPTLSGMPSSTLVTSTTPTLAPSPTLSGMPSSTLNTSTTPTLAPSLTLSGMPSPISPTLEIVPSLAGMPSSTLNESGIPSRTPSPSTDIPSSTGAPTESAVSSDSSIPSASPSDSIPGLPPSPGNPPCNICGGVMVVTNSSGIVELPTDPPQNLTCTQWAALGDRGFLTEQQCGLAVSLSQNCGCEEPLQNSLSPAGSVPTIAVTPDAQGTVRPSFEPTYEPSAAQSVVQSPVIIASPPVPAIQAAEARSPTSSVSQYGIMGVAGIIMFGVAML